MMPMKDLCPHLLATPRGQILSLMRHKELHRVQHEFLVMRIKAPSGRILWLRLDRAAGQIQSGVRRFLSEFAARDGARVYANEDQLKNDMAPNKVKARVFFDSPPTLLHLEKLLTVITQESKIYTVWQHNCYFFASVIQEILTVRHRGRLDGKLDYKTLGQDLRDRIRTRMEDSIG